MQDRKVQRLQFHNLLHRPGEDLITRMRHRPREDLITRMKETMKNWGHIVNYGFSKL